MGMRVSRRRRWAPALAVTLAFSMLSVAPVSLPAASAVPVGFGKSLLKNETLQSPTSLQFGPDGRLYVAERGGLLKVFDISRVGTNNYSVTSTEVIRSVRSIQNHNDNGNPNSSVVGRQVTGLLVTGTATRPVVYVTSSDPRVGGFDKGDVNLDTNSGILSRLTWTGSNWNKLNLVRGLPRSEETHASNGMALDKSTNTLFIAQGGNTNEGAPSDAFAQLPEYALSGAVLSVDLDRIGNSTYDLPTLNDLTRTGNPDPNDPFGGNDGRNQAKLVAGGPVQVYSPGYRNPYDLVRTRLGQLFVTDNGPGYGQGDQPEGEGPGGDCTNASNEPGSRADDQLHRVKAPGYYAGHPNPTRGNVSNTFGGQSPVPAENPVECDYRGAGSDGALTTFPGSTDGIAEYAVGNFGGAMRGDLLTAGWDNYISRIQLNDTGTTFVSKSTLFSSVGTRPLDITAQRGNAVFPGTIWVADFADSNIVVYEPNDYSSTSSLTRSGGVALAEAALPGRWETRAPTGFPRQEVAFVRLGSKFFLAGGSTRHQVYNAKTDSWRNRAPLPQDLDHIPGVTVGGKIYYIGGLLGWPGPQARTVYIYDPKTDTFSKGAPMPSARARGGGGAAVYQGKIYYAGGLHDGTSVRWFDVYDPVANTWSKLPAMPRARDHFQAAIVDGVFYAIGGRNTVRIGANDAFDFAAGRWITGLAPLPTLRGGFATAVVGTEVLVIGGEGGGQTFDDVEAYNTETDTWRRLAPMPSARHGIQAIVWRGGVYIAAGGTKQGGGGATDAHEVFFIGG